MNKNGYGKMRTILNMVLAPVTYYVVGLLVSVLAVLLITARLTAQGVGEDALLTEVSNAASSYTVHLTVLAALITIPIVFLLFYQRKTATEKTSPLKLVFTVPFGMSMCLTINMLISLSHLSEYFPQYEELAESIYQGNLWFELFGVALIPALVEELIYRGVVYRGFARFIPTIPAALISSLIFGVMHGNVVQFVYASLLGLLFCWVYEKYKSLWAPILMHMAANALSVLLTEWAPLAAFLNTTIGALSLLLFILVCDIAMPICIRMVNKRR